MKYTKNLIMMSAIIGLLISCQSEDNDSNGVELLFSINEDIVNYRSPGDLQFTDGFITIIEVEFSADKAGGGSVNKEKSGMVVYDFMSGQSTPTSNTIHIPAGDYKDVYLGIELYDENDKPSLAIEGTYEKQLDGKVYPLRFEFNSGEVFEAEAESATVPTDSPAIAKIKFDPHEWFASVSFDELESAKVNGQGVIVISESSNEDIFDLVADGLDLSTEAVFQ
ncbi:MAG: hypothetical protein R3275_13480 [Saprospiraceae bacterium]|nr:hypothetical protein [Saprospiraceae bacterium]